MRYLRCLAPLSTILHAFVPNTEAKTSTSASLILLENALDLFPMIHAQSVNDGTRWDRDVVPSLPNNAPSKMNSLVRRSQCVPGIPLEGARAPSTGTLHGAMVFVDFPDAHASETTRDIYNILEPNASHWYNTMSYGKLQLDIVPHMSKFFRMPNTSVSYNFQRGLSAEAHRLYIEDALSVIGTSVNFTGVNVLYIVPTQAASDITYSPTSLFSVTAADGTVIGNTVTLGIDMYDYWRFKVINHETGHTMGLPDLYPFSGGATTQWVGGFSIMGLITGQSPDYFAYHKWQLGWLNDSQVDCVTTNGTTTHRISPVESSDAGTKLVMIPINENASLLAEVRSRQGIDGSACGLGVLLYTSDTSIPSGEGPIRVIDSTPGSGGCDASNGGELNDAPFRLGSNTTIKYNNSTFVVEIDVVDMLGDDYIIRVNRNADNTTAVPMPNDPSTPKQSSANDMFRPSDLLWVVCLFWASTLYYDPAR